MENGQRENRQKEPKKAPLWGALGICALLVIVAIVVVEPLLRPAGEDELSGEQATAQPARQSIAQDQTIAQGCIFKENLIYQPCQHSVLRRVDAPANMLGLTREAMEKELPEWRVVSFSTGEVELSRELAIYCPAHYVLKPDQGGEICIWQNRLGQELDMLRALGVGVKDMPQIDEATLRAGIAFDTEQELEQYLEAQES